MRRILLVDGDVCGSETIAASLGRAGYQVRAVPTGHDAFIELASFRPDVALIDQHLPDMSGMDVLQVIRAAGDHIACFMTTAFGTCRSAVDATRLGARDYLEKPLDPTDLASRIAAVGRPPQPTPHGSMQAYARQRWADLIVRVIDSPADPKTLEAWARHVGFSSGALRNCCRTASLPPRRSLLFARVLRAVVLQRQIGWRAEDLLNIADQRTLVKVLRAAGGSANALPTSMHEFLLKQALITDGFAVAVVRDLAQDRATRLAVRVSEA